MKNCKICKVEIKFSRYIYKCKYADICIDCFNEKRRAYHREYQKTDSYKNYQKNYQKNYIRSDSYKMRQKIYQKIYMKEYYRKNRDKYLERSIRKYQPSKTIHDKGNLQY